MLSQEDQLLRDYESIFGRSEFDAAKLTQIGRDLLLSGHLAEGEKCFDLAVKCMIGMIEADHMNSALDFENLIYANFVKIKEDEEHYYQRFSRWTTAFQKKAYSLHLPLNNIAENNRICFVLQTGVMLGHTSVMLQVIDAWQRAEAHIYISVAVLGHIDKDFRTALDQRGVELFTFLNPLTGGRLGSADAIHGLRDALRENNIYTAVWVSVPTLASYALSLPLTHRQIFWSLKLHPVYLDRVALHVCGGHEREEKRTYNQRSWYVCPFPLAVQVRDNSALELEYARSKLPDDGILIGSLAREEKYNSPDFLDAIGSILVSNKDCYFLFTGRQVSPAIEKMAAQYGVGKQCIFVGWVDTNLYAELLDIFFETFPFGCGVTGFQAMAHGTPLLSFQAKDTLYGYQLLGASGSASEIPALTSLDAEGLPILTAIDKLHYIELAQRLIQDARYREDIGYRERAYVERAISKTESYADRLLKLILPGVG